MEGEEASVLWISQDAGHTFVEGIFPDKMASSVPLHWLVGNTCNAGLRGVFQRWSVLHGDDEALFIADYHYKQLGDSKYSWSDLYVHSTSSGSEFELSLPHMAQ